MPVNRLLLFAAIGGLAACSQAPQPAGNARSAANAATAPAAQAQPPAKPKPIGIDLAAMDRDVKPGDDFFAYANGNWVKNATIPSDRSSTSTFFEVFEKAEKQTSDLIRNAASAHAAAGSDAGRIAAFYAAWMDDAAIEKAGLAPLQPSLDAIAAIKTRADLARVLGSRLRADVDPINATNFHTENLFGLFVTKGLDEASTNIAYLLQGGLAMPSRDYYLSKDKAMAGFRDQYKAYVQALFKQAGIGEAGAKADNVLALETHIAQAQESLVESEDVHKANVVWKTGEFAKHAPGLDWPEYFKAAGLDNVDRIDPWQGKAIIALSALTASQPLQAWKDLLAFHTLDSAAPLLPKAYADLHFGFHEHALQGTPEQRERWKRAVAATNDDLGDAVGRLYVEKYFPASAKAHVEGMVKNIVSAFYQGIDRIGWMDATTKTLAKQKLAALHVGVGYPNAWRDYSSLAIDAHDALGNHQRAVAFEYAHQKAKIGTPIDRDEWWMTPQTVNAVNLPLQNALNFPAAILQPPFFDPQSDDAANYGAIGAIFGHEISHGFDNTGAEFDAQGRLVNWWTKADAAHFASASAALARQYDAYEALPGLHVDGKQTLGENIADVSGLSAAYTAYHFSMGKSAAPDIDGLTPDQRFFIAFAQDWRNKMRDAALRQRIATDVHAPARFRAQTVRNIDAWYATFNVQPGEKLYLEPDARVKLW